MTGELLRIIIQLGGSVRLQASGALALAGLFGHPLRDKLLRVMRQPFHKDEILRRLNRPPFTCEEIEAKLNRSILDEAKLDLFGPGDPEFEHVAELHAAACAEQRDNETVDAMHVAPVFESIIKNHAPGMSNPATADARMLPVAVLQIQEPRPNGSSAVYHAGEVPAGLGVPVTLPAVRKTTGTDGVPQSDRPTHSGSNASPVLPGLGLEASATGMP